MTEATSIPEIEIEPFSTDDDEVGREEEASIEASEPDYLAYGAPDPGETPPEPVRQPTRGERLVGLALSPGIEVMLMKARGGRIIDELSELPLNMIERNGQPRVDADHHKIVEEAIARQVDATMWAVKALTWGK
jgi:hypothetical protein